MVRRFKIALADPLLDCVLARLPQLSASIEIAALDDAPAAGLTAPAP